MQRVSGNRRVNHFSGSLCIKEVEGEKAQQLSCVNRQNIMFACLHADPRGKKDELFGREEIIPEAKALK